MEQQDDNGGHVPGKIGPKISLRASRLPPNIPDFGNGRADRTRADSTTRATEDKSNPAGRERDKQTALADRGGVNSVDGLTLSRP